MSAAAPALEARLWSALSEIQDPELPVSLVDLGLIYGLTLERDRVRVRLTFTAMGCPATDLILNDVRERLLQEPGVAEVDLELVWDPPWTSARLPPQGREELRGFGLSV